MDKSGHELALGLRLTPMRGRLREQGLGDLAQLVTPTSRGGCGVSYLNWGIQYMSFMPFDEAKSDLPSLVRATPEGTPWYWEVSSFVSNGPATVAGCLPSFARITKEELWTTALVARSYGARGLSAFNFIYTRNFSDVLCQLEENQPFSEPLFAELGHTKNESFISQLADQFYRVGLSSTLGSVKGSATVKLTMITPQPLGQWQHRGRLRLLLSSALSPSVKLQITLNGKVLEVDANTSSL
eukprot:COSAG04_NODE_6850_length_1242_cov_1.164479_1_plen_240_part_10